TYSPIEVSDALFSPTGLTLVDFDGDGDDDLIYSDEARDGDNGNPGAIYWHENMGDGQFGDRQLIVAGHDYIYFMKVIDIDGDDDFDIFYTTNNRYYLHRNLGSNVFTEREIVGEPWTTRYSDLNDFDQDGYYDLIYSTSIGEVWISYNDGNGNFEESVLVAEFPTGVSNQFREIRAVDVNNDGLKDVLIFRTNVGFGWYENLGDDQFAAYSFIEAPTLQGQDGLAQLIVYDLNGDNREDLVFLDLPKWYFSENIDSGTFQESQLFLEKPSYYNQPWVGHFDDDSQVDMFISSNSTFALGSDPLYRFNYETGGIIAVDSIVLNRGGFLELLLADYDADEDMDMAFLSSSGLTVGILENENNSFPNDYEEIGAGLGGIINLHGVDLNGDLLEDVLVASEYDDKISWYRQNPDGTFSDQIVVSRGEYNIRSIAPFDMDSDGDLDIVIDVAGPSFEYWLENNGEGSGWEADIVNSSSSIFEYPYLEPIDLDGDGALELLNFGDGAFKVFKYWNPGNLSQYFVFDDDGTGGTIKTGYAPTDIDNDGDIDLAAQVRFGNDGYHLGWYTNNGSAQFSELDTIYQIDNLSAGDNSLSVKDFDGDGLKDFMFLATLEPSDEEEIYLMKNLGDGEFSEPESIVSEINNLTSFITDDIDEDGDFDIIISPRVFTPNFGFSQLSQYTIWFENNGNGSFDATNYLDTEIGFFDIMKVVDFDHDNDRDYLMSSSEKNQVILVKNFEFSPLQATGTVYYDENQNGLRDSAEVIMDWIPVESNPASSFAYVTDTGSYRFSYTNLLEEISVSPQIPSNWEITSDSLSYTFSFDETTNFIDSLDFGIHPSSDIIDIEVNLAGGFALCESEVQFWVDIENVGSQFEQVVIKVDLDESVTFIGSSFLHDFIDGNSVYWSLSELEILEQFSLDFTALMPGASSISDPILTALTVFTYDETGSELVLDSDTISDEISCVYSGSGKSVFPTDEIIPLGQELIYTIRFQNTSTDTVYTAVVTDVLSEFLNWETFELIFASHPVEHTLDDQGLLVFMFDNILLPNSQANFEASQGYVKFKIEAGQDLEPNTRISNRATVYFNIDQLMNTNGVTNYIECYIAPAPFVTYNFPYLQAGDLGVSYQWYLNGIAISGATREIYNQDTEGDYQVEIEDENGCVTLSSIFPFGSLSASGLQIDQIRIFPNPSSDVVHLDLGDLTNSDPLIVRIFNLQGKLVHSEKFIPEGLYSIEKSMIGSGTYLMQLMDQSTGKIIHRSSAFVLN
ncbi:MAG: FG-GAP-like repeat-containing protein, partial [Bacteroidota bacterium]